jgi:VWFA-related protein
VAIYALTARLLILHDFTRDDAALVDAVNSYSPKLQRTPDPQVNLAETSGDPGWMGLQDALNAASGPVSDQILGNRIEITAAALKAIAQHIAIIPGRKNLVWVSGGFPIQMGIPEIGKPDNSTLSANLPNNQSLTTGGCAARPNQLPCPNRDSGTFDDLAKRAAEALNQANVAIYPVDAGGVAGIPTMEVGGPGGALNPAGGIMPTAQTNGSLMAELDTRDTSKLLAMQTGGLAFYGNNDVRGALKQAFSDGNSAYTIGFYPNHGEWNGKYRKLKIRTTTEGAKLRYRAGYYADAEKRNSDEARAKEAMRMAATSPLDATGLGMIVTGKLSGAPADRKVEVHVGLDPKQLLLQQTGTHRTGAVDLYFVQRDAGGETLAAENQRIAINFDDKQYEYLGTGGFVLGKHLTIVPQAADLRVFVQDTSSEALGSVTIPVPALFEGPQSPVPPAKFESPE